MELLFLAAILALFLAPTFVMAQRQRKRQQELHAMQSSLKPGQRVLSAGGAHGTVVAVDGTTVDLELAPGVVVRHEQIGIIRNLDTGAGAQIAEEKPESGS